jgi:hypothetical protein
MSAGTGRARLKNQSKPIILKMGNCSGEVFRIQESGVRSQNREKKNAYSMTDFSCFILNSEF